MELPYINITQIENSLKQEFEEDIIDEDSEFVNIGLDDDIEKELSLMKKQMILKRA